MKKLIFVFLIILSTHLSFGTIHSSYQVYSLKDTLFEKEHSVTITIDSFLKVYDETEKKYILNSKITYIGKDSTSKYYLDSYQNKISITYAIKPKTSIYSIIIADPTISNLMIIYTDASPSFNKTHVNANNRIKQKNRR